MYVRMYVITLIILYFYPPTEPLLSSKHLSYFSIFGVYFFGRFIVFSQITWINMGVV